MPPPASILRVSLVGLVALAVAMGIGRFAFTPLLPLMQDDGLLGIGDGGLLASVHFVGYWMGAVAASRFGHAPRAMLRLSLIGIGLCTVAMGLTDHLAPWLISRWLCGVLSAFTLVLVGNYTVRHLAEHGRPEAQGWVFSGVGAGIAVAGLVVLAIMGGGIGSAVSWQVFGAAALIAGLWVWWRMGDEFPRAGPAARDRAAERTPLVWGIVIAYGAMGIGYIIPATYLPVMAREIVPSPWVFGWSWPVFGAAAFVSTVLAVRLQKAFSNRQIWAASQVVMAVGLLLPALYAHMATIIIAGVCVGGTFMIITMVGLKEAHRIAPPQDVMRHIAIMTASFATGQMIGPVFAGALYDLTGGFSASLVVTSVLLVVTVIGLIAGASRKESVAT